VSGQKKTISLTLGCVSYVQGPTNHLAMST